MVAFQVAKFNAFTGRTSTECQALLEEHEKNEDSIDLALDRITEADDVDDQVEREIRRYWNDRVKTGRKDKRRSGR